MKYSPIDTIEIIDYQSLGNVVIKFYPGKKVLVMGYNSTGKTAIQRALEILNHNAYRREQTEHIRFKQGKFEVKVTLLDGTWVGCSRNANNIWFIAEKSDGTKYDTRHENERDAMAIENGEAPYFIQEIMGLIMDVSTKQKLNLRKEEDGLLFVNTTGSVNYKSVHSSLKNEQIATAIETLNNDWNTENREKEKAEGVRRYLLSKAEDVYDFSKLEENTASIETGLGKLEDLQRLLDIARKRTIVENQILPKLENIDFEKINILNEVLKSKRKIGVLKESVHEKLPEVDKVLVSKYGTLKSLLNCKSSVGQLSDIVHDLIKSVPVEQLTLLGHIVTTLRKIEETEVKLEKNIELISVDRLKELMQIIDVKNKLHGCKKSVFFENELKELPLNRLEELQKLLELKNKIVLKEEELKKCAEALKNKRKFMNEHNLRFCPNCSTIYMENEQEACCK